MAISLQQCVSLNQQVESLLMQTKAQVLSLANALKPSGSKHPVDIKRSLDTIATNNYQLSKLLLNVSSILSTNDRTLGDAAIKNELSTTMHKSNQIRAWISHWPQISNLVRMQVPAKRRKLFHKSSAANNINLSQLLAYDKAFDAIQRILPTTKQATAAAKYGCYPDISLPNSLFLENIHAAYRLLLAQGTARCSQFLDVGCGGGLKVLQASNFFTRSVGLEYDKGYVKVARKLLKKAYVDNFKVIHADGITFDGYADFNVVYFYRPMRNELTLEKLEQQIISSVAPETILIAPYEQFYHQHKKLGLISMGGSVYLAKTTKKRAKALRKRAELTGTFHNKLRFPTPTIWDPIISVSHQNGFGLVTG